MKLISPQEAIDQGYKSISTDLNPKDQVKKKAPRESFVRSLDAMIDGEVSLEEYIASIRRLKDSRYGISESDIIESMRSNMEGVDAAFIIFSPTKWQLARHKSEYIDTDRYLSKHP